MKREYQIYIALLVLASSHVGRSAHSISALSLGAVQCHLGRGQRDHVAQFAHSRVRSVAIGLVDDEDVGDLHDAGLERLHLVARHGGRKIKILVAVLAADRADPVEFARTGQWVPVVIGVVTALVVHLTKTAVRPAANLATAGVAAPVLSRATSSAWS